VAYLPNGDGTDRIAMGLANIPASLNQADTGFAGAWIQRCPAGGMVATMSSPFPSMRLFRLARTCLTHFSAAPIPVTPTMSL